MTSRVLAAPQAFAAVEALVAGAVAHGDVAAIGTGGGVALKTAELLAQGRKHPPGTGSGVIGAAVAVAVALRGARLRRYQNVGIVRERQVRHRPVYFFFDFFREAGQGQFGLGTRREIGFAVARDKLQGQPAEYVVNNGSGVADFGVLGKAGW